MSDKRQMKSAARLYAVQALFQMEATGQTFEAIETEFKDHRFGEVFEGEEMAEGDVTSTSIDHNLTVTTLFDVFSD